MGLSSKQVCSRGLDWNQALLESQSDQELNNPKPNNLMRKQQQQQQQHQHQQSSTSTKNSSSEALKCPRCESTNTKFCYYNNYNKSQPRHFCRACKRHWTKGGTLRNVPVGGARKNKRLKKPITNTTPTTSSSSTCTNPLMTIQTSLGGVDDQKSMPSSMYQSLLLQQNLMNTSRGIESKDDFGNGIFLGSTLPPSLPIHIPQNHNFLFPFSTSTSLQSSNVYNNSGEEVKLMEEPTVSSIVPNNNITQPWDIAAAAATTSGVGGIGIGMSSYWSWEDLDSLVSTDLNNNPWDDNSDIKP